MMNSAKNLQAINTNFDLPKHSVQNQHINPLQFDMLSSDHSPPKDNQPQFEIQTKQKLMK